MSNGSYEHQKVNVYKVRVYPLIMCDTVFATKEGNSKVVEIENHLLGNISLPFYSIKDSSGTVTKNVSQDYLMQFTGISLPHNQRKVADIWVGDSVIHTHWTVSLTKDLKKMYCMSPSSSYDTERYLHTRVMDSFQVNVVDYIETAVLRMILGFLGQYAKNRYSLAGVDNTNKSCMNCKAKRYRVISDGVEGDSNNPDYGSRGTFGIREEGVHTDNIICAMTMEGTGVDMDSLNAEYTRGEGGTDYLEPKLYEMKAQGCPKYVWDKSGIIPVGVHDVELKGKMLTLTTAGIKLIFNIGVETWKLPIRKQLSASVEPKGACVTGSRPEKIEDYDSESPKIYTWLLEQTEKLILNEGYNTFYTGMARGVDTIFAEVVIDLRKKYAGVKLIACVPFRGFSKMFIKDEVEKHRYSEILRQCDSVVVTSDEDFSPRIMQVRNEYMVNNSKKVLAVWNGVKGGTKNCIVYAMKCESKPDIQYYDFSTHEYDCHGKCKECTDTCYNPPELEKEAVPSLTYKEGNILEATEDMIIQQVNCKGVMGAGLAKQIRDKYPEVYNTYMNLDRTQELYLGNWFFLQVESNKFVASMCTQYDYGRDPNVVYTDYDAFYSTLLKVAQYAMLNNLSIAIPHNIGCGLANGDWSIVSKIIEEVAPNAVIYKLGGTK